MRNNEYLTGAMTILQFWRNAQTSSLPDAVPSYQKAQAMLLMDIAETLRNIEKLLERSVTK